MSEKDFSPFPPKDQINSMSSERYQDLEGGLGESSKNLIDPNETLVSQEKLQVVEKESTAKKLKKAVNKVKKVSAVTSISPEKLK